MTAAPGDVAVVRTHGILAWLIRLGAWLRRQSTAGNHVVIVIGNRGEIIEATPSGVRYGNLSAYDAATTVTNGTQNKTLEQRLAVLAAAKALLAHPYDWAAIARDAANVFDLDDRSTPWATNREPSRFVCSSLADYVYAKVGLPSPNTGAECTPADWLDFISANRYF